METAVSYIVTVYNKEKYLSEVLHAIAAERNATGGEIILVDDGSTDGSAKILRDFKGATPQAIILTQPNKGVAAATNAGIAQASCLYLRLVDADDRIVPGSTTRLIAALIATGCGFGFGRSITDEQPAPPVTGSPAVVIGDPLRQMLIRQPFIPATSLGVTQVIKQALPLPEDIRTAQDFSLGLKLAAITRFAVIEDACCIRPVNSEGLSSSKADMFRDTILLALRIGEEQAWPAPYRRLALARNAARARNYLRRHDQRARMLILNVSILAVVARLPFRWPYRPWMAYIASVYCRTLIAPVLQKGT